MKSGTWATITRSTEEEHRKFMQALKKLTFTEKEFLKHGPNIIFIKYEECMKDLKND